MDHLPTLKGSSTAHHSVPYLGTTSYGDTAFEEFPGQQGWNKIMLQEGDFAQGHDKRTAAAFLQTWLYFGMLFELSVAGRCEPPKTEEFVRPGGSRLITTQKLDDFIRKRVNKLANTSQQKTSEALNRLNRVLSDARLITEKVWILQQQESQRCPLPFEVIVSIMVLGCTIDSALLESQLPLPRRQWRLSEVARNTMEQNGWCRRDITLAATHLSEISMYYVMGMRRNEGDHSGCKEYACEVNQIDESTYQTKHRTANCTCQFWYADEERLQEMIRQDEIPYIQLKRNTKTKEGNVIPIEAKLKSFRNSKVEGPHNRMVIFSHVWSDGLGNPHHNALPMCQLSFFYDMLCDSPWQDIVAHQFEDPGRKKALIETDGAFPTKSMRKWNRKQFNTSIPIWIDTLCVPLEKTTKKKAISMLGRYYSFAGMTAVLDRELLALSHKQFSQSELLLRIGLSGWMRRCWTMQEAIIAGGSLCVRFSDGWLNVPDVVASLRKKNDIGVSLMNEEQQQSIKKSRKRLKAFCIPCAACIFILNLPSIIPRYICTALCKRGPKKAWKTMKPEKAPPSSTAADRLLTDSKAFFSIITSLCGKAASPKDREYMENRVQRMVLAWQGLRFRNTSHQEDRFINFAFACAKRQEDFQFMKQVLDQDTGDRLRCWLLGQPAVPSGLLFMKGPKMPWKGYKWAPSDIHPTAIEDLSVAKLLPAKNAMGAPEGSLQLQQPGFAFQGEIPRNSRNAEIIDHHNNSTFILELDWTGCAAGDLGFGRKALIVCGDSLAEASMTGAVLSNVVGKGGTYMGEFYCRAQVTLRPGVNSVSQGQVFSVDQQLGKGQTWVVS